MIKIHSVNLTMLMLFYVFFSCKGQASSTIHENKNSNNFNISIPQKLKEQISKSLIINNFEKENIDNDERGQEYIITASDSSATNIYEFWFKNNSLIHEFKYPWVEINYKWFVNLDEDRENEIIRAQGFEDEIDYVVYNIENNKQIPILYFNPILIDKDYPNTYFWGYPWDIDSLIIQNKKIYVSLNDSGLINADHPIPKTQIEIPYIFFRGHTTQSNFKIQNLKRPQFLRLMQVIGNVRKLSSVKLNNPISEYWNGRYQVYINADKDWEERCGITVDIKKDSIIFEESGYQTYQIYLLTGMEENNKLQLRYLNKLEGIDSAILDKTKDFGVITYDGKNYLWECPYLDILYTQGKKKTYVLKKSIIK